MIISDTITNIIGNHVPPYLYGKNFIPGETLIPYSGPYWDSQEAVAAINTFLNGRWISSGEQVSEFEKAFSRKFNTQYSLMVNSGSSANLVMISGLKKYWGWHDDDEIIVSPVAFPSTISVIYQNRLKPIFADIEWNTLNFDLTKVSEKITDRTVAIFLSPVLGNPPNMDRLVELCVRCNVMLILDNCDSLGSRWNGAYLNEYAMVSSCSFYSAHHICTGEGGMISTNDKDLMKIMRSMVSWGRDCTCIGEDNMLKDGSCGRRFGNWLTSYNGIVDHKYVFSHMGYNLKPLDLQGAIGQVQLKKFHDIEQRRKRSKYVITPILAQIKGVSSVMEYDGADVCWFGIPFICQTKELKQSIVNCFEQNKIQTRNYFSGNILLHQGYSFLDDYQKYPEANKVLDLVFFLGAAPHYGEAVFEYIDKVVKEYLL
jgi:CDP-6-deoxy-D-xylo-4-hexulose-3-dehydrase